MSLYPLQCKIKLTRRALAVVVWSADDEGLAGISYEHAKQWRSLSFSDIWSMSIALEYAVIDAIKNKLNLENRNYLLVEMWHLKLNVAVTLLRLSKNGTVCETRYCLVKEVEIKTRSSSKIKWHKDSRIIWLYSKFLIICIYWNGWMTDDDISWCFDQIFYFSDN